MPEDQDLSVSLTASLTGGEDVAQGDIPDNAEVLKQGLFGPSEAGGVPYPSTSRFAELASEAASSAYVSVPPYQANNPLVSELNALHLPVPYPDAPGFAAPASSVYEAYADDTYSGGPGGYRSGPGYPGGAGDGTYTYGSGRVPFGTESAGSGFGGGYNGGGGNGGYDGYGSSGQDGGSRPNWDAGNAWRKQRRYEQDRQFKDDIDNSEPLEATFNEDDFLDVEGKSYDDNWKGRFQERFDKFKGSKIGEWLGSTESAWALGFGGMQSVSNLTKALDPLVSGDAYLPDQVGEQSLTSALPLVGSILGALGGAKLGPGGGMGGQFLGQSIGAGAEDLIDKFTTGHIFAQERAGEAIGHGQGGAEVVQEVTDALKNALSPAVHELAETLTTAARSGRIGMAAPSELGQFQTEMGTSFQGNFAGEMGLLNSSPFLNPIKNTFLTNPFTKLTTTDYLGNAEAAAMQGDYAGEKASFAFAEAENERNSEDPAYQRDNDFVKRRDGESPWERGAEDLFEPTRVRAYNLAKKRLAGGQIDYSKYLGENDLGQRFYGTTDPENKYLPGYEGRKETLDQAEKEIDDDRNVHIADEGKILFGQAQLGRDSSALTGALARGGGARAAEAYLGEMRFDTTGEIAALNEDAAKNFADAQKYTNPAQRNTFLAAAAGDQAKVAEVTANLDTSAKSAFDLKFGEEQATFEVFATRDTLRGDSAAQMQGGYDRQADFLSGTAANPRNPLSPSERAGIEQSAEQMRYTAGHSVYQEAVGWAGVRDVQGQGQIGIAQTYGSPMDVYHADIAQVADEQSQIGIIDNRLRQNIPMSERITLSGQRQQIQNAVSVAPEQARLEAYSAEGSILGNDQAAGRSLLDRNAQVYGAKAYTPDIFAADQTNVDLYTGAENGSPIGSQQRAQFGRERADAQAQMQRDRDASYQFGDQAMRVRDMQAEGQFDRDMKNPYQDGDPNNNPMTAGRALEGVYERDLTGAEAALKNTPRDSPTYEKNAGIVEDYKDKIADIEERRRMGFAEMLPEIIAGTPGQGNLSGILPTPGQSAFYNPNAYISGTFGQAPRSVTSDGEAHMPQPGGTVGAFLAATNTDGGIAALTSEMKRLNDNLMRGNLGGRSPASTGNPSGFSQNLNLTLPGNGYSAGR